VYCVALQKTSDSMLALAEDHRNDIISNLAAIGFGAIASQVRLPPAQMLLVQNSRA